MSSRDKKYGILAASPVICALFALSFFVGHLFFCQKAQAGTEAKEEVFVLKQKSDVFGFITTYIIEKHLKIEIGKPSTYLVANAPSWRVMVANDLNKRTMTMGFKQWMAHFPQTTYCASDWDRCKTQVTSNGVCRILGRPCLRFCYPSSLAVYNKQSPPPPVRGDYCVLEKHFNDATACHIMQKAVSAPVLPAVPIVFTQTESSRHVEAFTSHFGGVEHWLSTDSISEGQVPIGLFSYPVGYKQVQREAEVMDDKNKKNSVDDFARELISR